MSPDVFYAIVAALSVADLSRLIAAERAAGRKHAIQMAAIEAKRGAT